jgi:hypothetical protein
MQTAAETATGIRKGLFVITGIKYVSAIITDIQN